MNVQRGIHWPYCIDRSCIGCMPELPPLPEPEKPTFDSSLFRKPED